MAPAKQVIVITMQSSAGLSPSLICLSCAALLHRVLTRLQPVSILGTNNAAVATNLLMGIFEQRTSYKVNMAHQV
jgi:hypothetical protein